MKRILVPTDFSETADHALEMASQIAKQAQGEIVMLHCLEIPLHLATSGDTGGLPEGLFFVKLAEKRCAEVLNKPYLKDVVVHQRIGHGEIFQDVMEAIEEEDIDVVVMGSHGASGFQEMFIGSNTEKVVRTSSVPVLVVKQREHGLSIKDFVFATDFTEECKAPYHQAQKFLSNMGATIHLLFVNTPNDFRTNQEIKEQMQEFIKDLKDTNYTLNIYNDHSVEKGILNFAQEIDAHMIGMSTHGRKGLAHFFNGSISEDLVNHAKRPVMTFRIT
jgi:nucleotide-binding universal stress UspA family protein